MLKEKLLPQQAGKQAKFPFFSPRVLKVEVDREVCVFSSQDLLFHTSEIFLEVNQGASELQE